MASNSFRLEVVTPEKKLYSGEADIVIVKTKQGYEGFMAKHAWACKLLDTGELLIKEAGESGFRSAATSGGFIDVKDKVTVFAESAEWSEDIDEARATAAKEAAEEKLAELKSESAGSAGSGAVSAGTGGSTEDGGAEDGAGAEGDERADAAEEQAQALVRAVNRLKVKAGGYLGKK